MPTYTRFGKILVDKGFVDYATIDQAIVIQKEEESYPNRRRLGEILVSEFDIDHDKIFKVLADLYAFRSLAVSVKTITEEQKKRTKEILTKFPEDYKKSLLYKNILPFKQNNKQR